MKTGSLDRQAERMAVMLSTRKPDLGNASGGTFPGIWFCNARLTQSWVRYFCFQRESKGV
jgi:hypothetical protein